MLRDPGATTAWRTPWAISSSTSAAQHVAWTSACSAGVTGATIRPAGRGGTGSPVPVGPVGRSRERPADRTGRDCRAGTAVVGAAPLTHPGGMASNTCGETSSAAGRRRVAACGRGVVRRRLPVVLHRQAALRQRRSPSSPATRRSTRRSRSCTGPTSSIPRRPPARRCPSPRSTPASSAGPSGPPRSSSTSPRRRPPTGWSSTSTRPSGRTPATPIACSGTPSTTAGRACRMRSRSDCCRPTSPAAATSASTEVLVEEAVAAGLDERRRAPLPRHRRGPCRGRGRPAPSRPSTRSPRCRRT